MQQPRPHALAVDALCVGEPDDFLVRRAEHVRGCDVEDGGECECLVERHATPAVLKIQESLLTHRPPSGLRGYRLGKHVRYRREDVEEWLAERSDDARRRRVKG